MSSLQTFSLQRNMASDSDSFVVFQGKKKHPHCGLAGDGDFCNRMSLYPVQLVWTCRELLRVLAIANNYDQDAEECAEGQQPQQPCYYIPELDAIPVQVQANANMISELKVMCGQMAVVVVLGALPFHHLQFKHWERPYHNTSRS